MSGVGTMTPQTPSASKDSPVAPRSGRTRRKTAKAVDYSKEQQFSDGDVFEDEAREKKEAATPSTTGRKNKIGRPRKSVDPESISPFYDGGENSSLGPYNPNGATFRYTEKGYDPTQLPIRDRYLFEPEYELDGSPKIELIVGRRPIKDKGKKYDEDSVGGDDEDDNIDDSSDEDESEKEDVESSPKVKRKRGRPRKNPSPDEKKTSKAITPSPARKHIEYEYLVKYKGKSYLHLQWKTASDLESMNKSAKTLYRRFLKKLKSGSDDTLEDPTFDNAYAVPQKIVDEKDHTMVVELSDKELIAWEKKRERELAEEKSDSEEEQNIPPVESSQASAVSADDKSNKEVSSVTPSNVDVEGEEKKSADDFDDDDEDVDLDADDGIPKIDKIRKILNKDGPYYPKFEGSDNPYRDGYLTHPPKKPRASYLFFQCTYRAEYQKKYKGASQGEIMTLLGDTWRSMTEEEQAPFLELAKEEVEHFERERVMMEKAQRPNELWQPIRRCRMVLDRLTSDSYSTIFLEPVSLIDFPDYEEAIDQPMDLGTIRKKLDTKKYQAPEIFARDMRKVWNNCKVFNQHGSAIWHVADYMSKQFERLYQAWVLNYRERYLRWINPKARPWEQTCRQCDGKCGTPDEKMVLCDHCDSMYGMACLKPRLRKLPKGVWHCPDCIKFKHDNPAARMLSALYEQAARKRAELGDIPKKEVKRRMFLVKWAGLGYENCTWELEEDINDDALIAEFRKLNNMVPDEPTLKVKEVEDILTKSKHISVETAKGHACIPDLRAQLYAQSRAIQFSKFGMPLPDLLGKECGSRTNALITSNEEKNINEEVVLCMNDLVSKVTRGEDHCILEMVNSLPPLMTGEYDAVIPITDKGLMMNVGEIHGSVSFLGYREFPDGTKGPAERANLIRNVGDKIIAVDGVTTVNKTFQEVIQLLRKSGKNKFAYMRFLEMKYGVCNSELTSMGRAGQYVIDEVTNKLKGDRKLILAKRKLKGNDLDEEKHRKDDEDSDDSVGSNEVSDDDSEGEESEGDLVADGDDYELVLKERMRQQESPSIGSSLGISQDNIADDVNSTITEPTITAGPETNENQGPPVADAPTSDSVKSSSQENAESERIKGMDSLPSEAQSTNLSMDDADMKSENPSEKNDETEEDVEMKDVSGEGENEEQDFLTEDKKSGAEAENEIGPDDENKDENNNSTPVKDVTIVKSNEGVAPPVISSSELPQSKELPKDKLKMEAILSNVEKPEEEVKIYRQENTRSLALRLLDVDIGYSSDEGGFQDYAYFIDGVDLSFSKRNEVEEDSNQIDSKDKKESDNLDDDESDNESTKKEKSKADKSEDEIPVKQNEFSTLGERCKLALSSIISRNEPKYEDFDQFPQPSKASIEAEEREKEAARIAEEKAREEQEKKNVENMKSTTKVEQLSTINNDVLRVWATVEEASATLQIPLKEIKQILSGEYNEELGDEVGGFRWRYADEDAEVTKGATTGRDSKKGKQAFLEFRDKLYDHRKPHNYKDDHRLRDYQIDGLNWLASCWYKRHSCILADEMGLGKTVQIVTYIEHLHRVEKIPRPFLIVVPLSTVEHWRREFEGWTDMQCCIYHDRQREWRDVMREYEWYYADRPHTPDYLKFDVLVTTYDTLIGDYDVLGQIPWRVTVVDEAHRLRNVKGKLLECMKQISARGTLQYGFQSRVLMTGTPLQNNTQELWTLLNFIEPYKFPSLEDFQLTYGNMANREQVESLQKKISPFMLRRVKEDVAKDIPAKEETLIDVELTSIQKQYYRAIFEHNHAFLSMGTNRATAPKLMNIQMELRKCCNHPFLLDGVETRELEKYHKELFETGKVDGKSAEDQQAMLNEHGYINTSGKMVLLNKLLPKLRQEGHKVLIFSQMVKMLDLISEFCDYKGFRYERLDGRVRGNERQKAIDRFETEEDSFVFLLSTRAGGVGINLTAADICIIFDSDWNPQNDVQAQARCHRIGQTKDVMIYRLITSRTFEQEMFDRASKKLGLEQAVLGTFGQDNDDGKPTSKEMEQLLKKGAYALLEDENDEIGKEFCEDDIESILAKRTRTRVVEGAKTSAWLNKSGLNVSKSKFTAGSSAATANVDVDDPLFWQKVMPDFVTPTIMMTKLKDIIKLVEKPNAVDGPGRGRKKKNAVQESTSKVKEDEKDEKTDNATEKTENSQDTEGNDTTSAGKKEDEKEVDKEGEKEAESEGKKEEEKEGDQEGKKEEKKGKKHKDGNTHPTRTLLKKASQFMGDLASMMEGILEDVEDDNLPQSEKTICQNLLLMVSVKEKIFSNEQRIHARKMLKRLEGDRRRRCRTNGDESGRFSKRTGDEEESTTNGGSSIPEELMILSKHKRRKRRLKEKEKEREKNVEEKKMKRVASSSSLKDERSYIGDDGFRHHSDSEADWSDVAEDMYKSKRKRGISRKEARRRRAWASDKDSAAAAGRLWPVFPRNVVTKVLRTMLDDVIKSDKEKGGLFSVPVPIDQFPEYYDVVKRPMDYGTMKKKLEGGEYRSAQAMQKDFILVMQNCLQFNSPESDIVKEARRQALGFPSMLKNASSKHNLFLAEDGTILHIQSEDEEEYNDDNEDGEAKTDGKGKRKKKLPLRRKYNRKSTASGASSKRCKECEGCKREEDCGECTVCLDADGKGKTSKSGCLLRVCVEWKKTPTKPTPKKRGRKKKKVSDDEAEASDSSKSDGNESSDSNKDTSETQKKKPRIRISLANKDGDKPVDKLTRSTKKKGKKRTKTSTDKDSRVLSVEEPDLDTSSQEDSLVNDKKRKAADEDFVPADFDKIPKRKIRKTRSPKVESPKPKSPEVDLEDGEIDDAEAEPEGNVDPVTTPDADITEQGKESDTSVEDPAKVFLDLEKIKEEMGSLDGSLKAAREFVTKRGAWFLPKNVLEEKWYPLAKQTLTKMKRHDGYRLFAEKVTDDEAPGYSDVIKNPMDFGTMLEKLDNSAYGKGSEALSKLYHDYLLVFDNCALYNDAGSEVADEAARVMTLLPEVFANACATHMEKVKGKRGRKRKNPLK